MLLEIGVGKILLVDDEEALRLVMGRQLRRAGHNVTLAEDGFAAFNLIEAQRFDLVVSDMRMPRLGGMDLLAKAREIAPDTEFVVLTGHGSMENAVEAFKQGNVFDYMLKPLNDIFETQRRCGTRAGAAIAAFTERAACGTGDYGRTDWPEESRFLPGATYGGDQQEPKVPVVSRWCCWTLTGSSSTTTPSVIRLETRHSAEIQQF